MLDVGILSCDLSLETALEVLEIISHALRVPS